MPCSFVCMPHCLFGSHRFQGLLCQTAKRLSSVCVTYSWDTLLANMGLRGGCNCFQRCCSRLSRSIDHGKWPLMVDRLGSRNRHVVGMGKIAVSVSLQAFWAFCRVIVLFL